MTVSMAPSNVQGVNHRSITGQLHRSRNAPLPLVSDLHREFAPSGLRGRLGPSTD